MNKIKKYFEIKTQIKELQGTLKLIENDVFNEVALSEDGKLTTDFCRFQIVYRPKWQYSSELSEKAKLVSDKIKIMKKEEELNGKAEKISDGGQLRMTSLKETN